MTFQTLHVSLNVLIPDADKISSLNAEHEKFQTPTRNPRVAELEKVIKKTANL